MNTQSIFRADERRWLMMQSGMACETGMLELTGGQTVNIPHNLPSDNIIGILQRRNPEETLGTGNPSTLCLIPPSMSHVKLENAKLTGIYVGVETRGSSTTSFYQIFTGYSNYYNPRPSFRVTTRSVNYPLNGTYDYILIATDVFRSHNSVPFAKKLLNLATRKSTFDVPNPFGEATDVLAMAVKREAEYGVNGLNGGFLFNDHHYSFNIRYALESRSSMDGYSNTYVMNTHAINNNYFRFGTRNGSYPYLPGDYDILLIKFPPFNNS